MFVIGERINGMFVKVKKAIEARDKSAIQKIARRQLDAGADALDINVGPVRGSALDNMCWMIEAVEEVTDAPICIDTPKFDVMNEALHACSNPTIINSTKAIEEELDRYVPLMSLKGRKGHDTLALWLSVFCDIPPSQLRHVLRRDLLRLPEL